MAAKPSFHLRALWRRHGLIALVAAALALGYGLLEGELPVLRLLARAAEVALLALLVNELRAQTWWLFHRGVDLLAEQDEQRHAALIARLEQQDGPPER